MDVIIGLILFVLVCAAGWWLLGTIRVQRPGPVSRTSPPSTTPPTPLPTTASSTSPGEEADLRKQLESARIAGSNARHAMVHMEADLERLRTELNQQRARADEATGKVRVAERMLAAANQARDEAVAAQAVLQDQMLADRAAAGTRQRELVHDVDRVRQEVRSRDHLLATQRAELQEALVRAANAEGRLAAFVQSMPALERAADVPPSPVASPEGTEPQGGDPPPGAPDPQAVDQLRERCQHLEQAVELAEQQRAGLAVDLDAALAELEELKRRIYGGRSR